jgi:hypothetical protein
VEGNKGGRGRIVEWIEERWEGRGGFRADGAEERDCEEGSVVEELDGPGSGSGWEWECGWECKWG